MSLVLTLLLNFAVAEEAMVVVVVLLVVVVVVLHAVPEHAIFQAWVFLNVTKGDVRIACCAETIYRKQLLVCQPRRHMQLSFTIKFHSPAPSVHGDDPETLGEDPMWMR